MIAVALLDLQSPLLLESLSTMLAAKEDILVTGQFSRVSDFIRASRTVTINVLIIHLHKFHSEEIDLIKKISSEMSRIKVLVISMENDERAVYESIRAGAKGLLTKNDTAGEVVMAVYSLRNGYDYFNKPISEILRNNCIRQLDESGPGNLSKREIEIIRFWGEGLSNPEIADRLNISTRTVESHKNHIMQKLNFKTNIDLLKFAIKNNLIEI